MANRCIPYELRTFDILYDYPEEEIPVWQRPWLSARLFMRYPVEYRVFVEEGVVVGISNYYIQRSLAAYPSAESDIDAVKRMVVRLVKTASADSFSADFMKLDDTSILFLEGGPPFSSDRTHPTAL